MSPDQAEQDIESFQAAEASSEAMQAAWDQSNALIPTIPYEPAFMLPTGLNLLRPMAAYGADAEVDRFFSSMDEEAVAYHLGLPLNLSKQDLSISGPEPLPSTRDAASPPATDTSSWLPETEPTKRVKDVIDVPPFLRNKLLDSYFHNLQRCPCHCVDRDQLNRRLEGTENRPHPTWLFSMYLHGLVWLQDPTLKHMESHFYTVAKESWDSGLAQMQPPLDLFRGAVNLSIYLIRRNRERESVAITMQLVSLARTCGLNVGRYKRGSPWSRCLTEGEPLRQMMCCLDVPTDDAEVQDRLELLAAVRTLDTFGTMVTGRPPWIDSHLTEPIQYFLEDAEGSEERFVTLQDLFDGQPVDLCGEKPSGSATRIAASRFNLTFLPRKKIGQQHRSAKIAVDSLVAAFPPHWHDIRNYPSAGTTAVSERSILLALWSTIHVINAYICEIDPTLNERPVDHAKKMVHYLPLIQDKIHEMPMQMTIYLEFCGKALAEEAGRLRSTGWHQAAYSLERLAGLTMSIMAKVARVYGLHDRVPTVFYAMHSRDSAGNTPPFVLNPQS
ncbi:hypothetical protein NCC49_003734 [Naganishia albida]|nr:hypothetical protein NCC49_003734 [Naganishia albida]